MGTSLATGAGSTCTTYEIVTSRPSTEAIRAASIEPRERWTRAASVSSTIGPSKEELMSGR